MKALLKHRETQLVAVILAMVGLIALRFPSFVAPASLGNVFNDTSILIILALGQMTVILTKCVDLSTAATLALSGMVAAMLNNLYPDLPVLLLVVVAILTGVLAGAINGLLVWRLDIPPIVVTLGTMTIYRGIIFLISDGKWINAHEMTDAFKAVPRADFLGIPVLSWMALSVTAIMAVLLRRLATGRAFYAVGGNPHAAVYTGIDVGYTRFLSFVLSGALSGLAGYLWIARYAVAYVDIALGFELDVVAACVIGGISIAGGIGTVFGAVLGSLFLGTIKNALPVINISPFWQLAISGSVIILAVAFNARAERRKGRVILKKAEVVA
ncbi:ABC transporter permease [Gellertiella hungarica]|uniref:Rhamnose transport system permease protein n=1 Tax=Gellertiella hungarica TaxID=1572859 RepID=A0A7W6J7G4_9HYPH|nr:ABC transporter permease [Gellertiella hungarica]MBB4066211.1 rhamnose transport system permease protein [Gellertiella hungarica]